MGTSPAPHYDRRGASEVLARLAAPGLFAATETAAPARITVRVKALQPEADSHLTQSQRMYLERFMRPCRPEQVTSATHRITWTDSAGVPNTGYFHTAGTGPALAVVARETVLALWRSLADAGLPERATDLPVRDQAVLTATTTDHDPHEIFRVGVEATGRALVQHGLIAADTPYRGIVELATGLRDSGIFAAVATRWFWELQASTFRRGMIPVRLATQPDGSVRYTAESIATLRAMKDATIADAGAVMRRATTEEGLDTEAAVAKYHDDLDLISRQYALLAPGTRPTCLAAAPRAVDGTAVHVLATVVDRFVETVAVLADTVEVVEDTTVAAVDDARGDDGVFSVPDMSCRHCVRTITALLESMDIPVVEIDLEAKRVVAGIRSPRNRFRVFEALRDGGYNPIDNVSAPAPGASVG
ncbi:heavy-metal-associated domain-containing protein [Nocardia mangyaensis]|uniref:heavy-metal-associated domain-containing protein n=1 Tax=Nocardia mangyaensis TaxID=2213200 RepID=UPI0026771D47|nr:heavy-metal-associated domain-containing protein [Nocardia mangyaensis]MDO3646512.1 heavy-metal-associated domain-containing protein [Nocardia mangyaensis]